MSSIARRTIALAAVAVALIAAAVALDLPSAAAQSEDEQAGRIVARRLDDGRTEFGWRPAGGERVLPRLRYFPANVDHQRWLNSSPVEVDGAEIGRINARLTDDGRIEFAFTPTDGERIAPSARYFPADARVDHWLRSTEITIGPPAPAGRFTAVSAGSYHNCAIRAGSGEIECWGDNNAGQNNAPAGSFTAVNAGSGHTCALRTSGAIECWGSNHSGEATPPAGSFIAVSAASRHTCAIRESGEIACWGYDLVNVTDYDGNVIDRYPTGRTDAPAGRFSAVSAGSDHNCAIRTSGEIACWGADGYPFFFKGQSSSEWELRPSGRTDAPAGSDFIAVSVGYAYSCALRESGEITCWGRYSDRFHTPPAGSFIAVSAGDSHTCAIRTNGEIACWGRDLEYPPIDRTDAPAGPFTAVSAGSLHTCAIRESGELACWGDDRFGQLDAPAP